MNEPSKLQTRYLLGLDIGQAQDPTALVVLERFLTVSGIDAKTGEKTYAAQYHMRHIERFHLGSSYGAYEDKTREICTKEPVKGNSVLVVDHTGVGARVVEALREKLQGITYPVPVNITAGTKVNYEDGVYNVPKRDLVGVIHVLLSTGRLKFAQELPLATLLMKELQNFRIKYTQKGNDTYEAWREGDHDDLVLATALACWWGENHESKNPSLPYEPPPDRFAHLYRKRWQVR